MFANVLNYLYHMLCSRMLGVVDYGILATLVAGYSIFGAIVNVLNLTTAKFIAELWAVEDAARLRSFSNLMMRVCGIVAFVVVITTFATLPLVTKFLQIDYLAIAATGAAIAASLLVPAWRGVLQGVQDYVRLSISTTLESFVRLLSGVALTCCGYRAGGAIMGFAIGNLVALLYTGFALGPYTKKAAIAAEVKIDTKRLAQTGGGVAISTLALTVLGFVDVVLVRHFLDPHDAGLYGVLSLTGKIIIFSVSFLPTVLLPKAVEAATHGKGAWRILMQAGVATAILSLLVVGVYMLAPETVVRVLAGPAFLAVAPFVGRYGIATALLAATTLAATFKIGVHQFAFTLRLLAVAALEISAIVLYHADIAQIVDIVIAANTVGLIVTLIPERARPTAQGIR